MLSLQLFDSPNGRLVADDTGFVTDCQISHGAHGYEACSWSVPLAFQAAYARYRRAGVPHVAVSDRAGGLVWEGRLEDVTLTDTGLTCQAFGYYRALSDLPYTALWSDTRRDTWRVLPNAAAPGYAFPDRYEISTSDALSLAPRKNSTVGNIGGGGNYGAYLHYARPDQSSRTLAAVTFDYAIQLPSASWEVAIDCYTTGLAYTATAWTHVASGVLQTGTQTVTFAACDEIAFRLYYDAASATYAGETGDAYVRITNIRVKSTTASTVTLDAIAANLVLRATTTNPAHLSADTTRIQSPGGDLLDAVYEDADGAAILDDLTGRIGWAWGVGDGRRLYLRPAGSGARTWYVDVTSLEMQRTLETLRNSAYAVYTDADGVTRRTGAATDAGSVRRTGLVRRQAVSVDTTSATEATTARDTALAASANPPARARMPVPAIYDAQGAQWPLYRLRAGDTIVARNLPIVGVDADMIRAFPIARVDYDAIAATASVEPATPTPGLDIPD